MFPTLFFAAIAAIAPQHAGSPLDSIARIAITRNLGVRRATENERQA